MGQPLSARDVNEAKLEALIETMYVAAQADGEFTMQERAHFVSSVQSLTEQRLEGEKLDRLLAEFEDRYQRNGRRGSLAAVKSRLGDERTCKLALSMAIQMLASDGILRTSENEFVLEMADTLGIDRGGAADLVREITG